MKSSILLFAFIALSGCASIKTTTEKAKQDFYNFKKTITYNLQIETTRNMRQF
jgi:uncharacterized protein YceK